MQKPTINQTHNGIHFRKNTAPILSQVLSTRKTLANDSHQNITPTSLSDRVKEVVNVKIVGVLHSEASGEMELKYINKALKKEIVFVNEGLSNTDSARMHIAKLKNYTHFGYLFGMEDELVNCFTNMVCEDYAIVFYMAICPDKFLSSFDNTTNTLERCAALKDRFLGNLLFDPFTRNIWKAFTESDYSHQLDKNIISVIEKFMESKIEMELAMRAIIRTEKTLSLDACNWLFLLNNFGLYILHNYIAKLPKEKRPNIDKIQEFLTDPTDQNNALYIRYDLNVYWRDIFIKENIKEALEFARSVAKPLAITIGQDHFDDINSFLSTEDCIALESHPCDIGNHKESYVREQVAMEERRIAIEERNIAIAQWTQLICKFLLLIVFAYILKLTIIG